MGYAHPIGMTIAAFALLYGERQRLEVNTLKFFEVAASVATALDMGTMTEADARAAATRLPSTKTLDTDAWLLAVGTPAAGTCK